MKWMTQIFWFPSAYKSYVYTTLYSVKYAVEICLKKNNVRTLMIFL